MIKSSCYPLFSELSEAIVKGYCDHFRLLHDGSLQCLSNPDNLYTIDDVRIEVISCYYERATLYLISTKNGLHKGTCVEFWEHHS